MTKCLVTKLNGSVDNNDLLRIGEMRIKVESVESPTKDTQGFRLGFIKPTTVEIVGNGYFTDKTLTENKGKSMTFSSSDDIIVSQATTVAIRDKYNLKEFAVYIAGGTPYGENKVFKIDDLKYSYGLSLLNASKMQVCGDIANLKNLTALAVLYLTNTQVSGDIANLKNLTALTILVLSNTQVSGDIANLKNLTALTILVLSNTQVSGDIANLKNLTALTTLKLSNTQVSGDIANIYFVFSGNTKEMDIGYCNNLSGDLASVPDNILFFNNYRGNSKFTWKKGSTRTNVLACTNIHCDKIDDMLNDMANMTASFIDDEVYKKTIQLIGPRTSASDAAVQTLQSKGYTVSVSPA